MTLFYLLLIAAIVLVPTTKPPGSGTSVQQP